MRLWLTVTVATMQCGTVDAGTFRDAGRPNLVETDASQKTRGVHKDQTGALRLNHVTACLSVWREHAQHVFVCLVV